MAPTLPGQLLVTIATYNEIENLPRLISEVHQFAPQADILVIDDNSPDGTGQWCDKTAKTEPRLHCLHRSGKLGLGTATIAGMQYAIEHGYELVLNMDADFSHHPRYLPALIAGMDAPTPGSVDVMVGSRYIQGGAIEGWPLKRHFMSRGINWFSRLALGIGARDCSGAFRCYRVSRLKQLDFSSIRSRGYSFQEELLWRLQRLGCRISEAPITFVDRISGASKINASESANSMRILLQLGLQNWFGKR
ncbi:MAG: polyprenol monophosphomannose synthase [Planctomycetes bacterium]|nr:polyprenol monophosphomannose synthase [Planctomycetota bacterium]